jgi:hypothetical protein
VPRTQILSLATNSRPAVSPSLTRQSKVSLFRFVPSFHLPQSLASGILLTRVWALCMSLPYHYCFIYLTVHNRQRQQGTACWHSYGGAHPPSRLSPFWPLPPLCMRVSYPTPLPPQPDLTPALPAGVGTLVGLTIRDYVGEQVHSMLSRLETVSKCVTPLQQLFRTSAPSPVVMPLVFPPLSLVIG